MSKIIGKLRFDAGTKKINSGVFSVEVDYSKNSEYIEMMQSKNYIEVSQEQADLWNSNNQNGIEMCVIDGVLQLFVEADDVKLERAKADKLRELANVYSNISTWEFTLKDIDGTLTQSSDWLLAKISTKPIFYDDEGNVMQKTFTVEKVFEIIDKINAKGFEILTAKKTITTKINSAKKIADIEKIDIEKEFATVKKIITIS